MKRAFLFDMDGVIVDSEKTWQTHGADFARKLYGDAIVDAMGDTTGMSLDHEYDFATQNGFAMDKDEFYHLYDEQAKKMYAKTVITEGLEDLVNGLKQLGFITGIVSSSRRLWIEMVLEKIPEKNLFDYTISLNEKGLPSKPSPEGYLYAMKEIGSIPATTIILEDSNNGITSAKESGAFVIGFTPLLIEGYKQIFADAAAHSMSEVLQIVKERLSY